MGTFDGNGEEVRGNTHRFFIQITGKRAQRIADRTWDNPRAEVVREAAGTQISMTYIGRQQATVAKCVALRPIFEVFTGEKGYEMIGLRREAWWSQEVTEKQLWETLTGVSQEANRSRLQGERAKQ